jgi:hypothetical protein
MVAHAYNHSYLGGEDRRIKSLRPALDKGMETLSQKQNKIKEMETWLKW